MSKDNLICIYNETKENADDIIFKIYENFIDKELEKEFKAWVRFLVLSIISFLL